MQFSISNKLLLRNKFMFQIIIISIINLFLIRENIFCQTFNYTGSVQTWTVPPCVTSITITAAGADGGGAAGGNGAVLSGTLAVTPGQVFQINVGGSGGTGAGSGGYNGGGNGEGANSAANQSGGGGGATSMSVSPFGLANRIIVAAGGGGFGGGTTDAAGGAGGCATGTTGVASFGGGGTGGTQSAGGTGGTPWGNGNNGSSGSLGVGAAGATDGCYNYAPGGGGGGGYYGGGSGGADCWASGPIGGGGGGGGSSLFPAGVGCTPGTNNGPGYLTITYTVGVGIATATNTGPYCVGATIQLNASSGTSYSWTGPNSFTSTLQNPTIPLSTISNAGVYTVIVNNSGCLATATTTVVINALPIVNAGNDQTVCAGTTTTLNASGATTYSWNNGINNNVAFTQAVGNITYTVTGTTSGCTNTDQVTVIVNPIPVVNAGQDVSICAGSAATLTASGATTYSWSPNGQTSATLTESPILTSTYTVTGTTLGCSSSDDVQIIILPDALIDAGQDVILCEGFSSLLSASGGTTYSWDNGIGIGNNVSITPLLSTTYTVTGTDALGCIGTDDITITVNTLPIINAGIDQAVCAGSSVTLSGAGASIYTWDNGVADASAFVPLATATYTVIGTDINGCINTDQVDVTVNLIPVVDAGIAQAICIGGSVILSGSGAATYTWDNSVTDGVAFSPITTTNYTVTGISAAGCISTDQVIVTVNLLPIVDAGLNQTVCSGTSVTLIGAGASTYTWTNGITNNIGFTPVVGTLTYTVTGTSIEGCESTDLMDVIVNPLPAVSGGLNQSICAGAAVTLTGAGAATYTWNNGITNGLAFTPVSTATYTVTGTSIAGCVNTDQVLVTVNPIPVVFAGNDVTFCAGQTLIFSGSGAATYTWDNGISNGIAFNPPPGTTTYTVTGTTAAGCVNTDQVVSTIVPIPVVSFNPNITSGCVPLTVNFTNTTANSANCVWTISDGTLLTGCGSVTNTFTQAGCFDITLTTTLTNGCIATFTSFNLVCVEALPIAAFSPSSSMINEENSIVQFQNNTLNGSTYLWNFGDNSPTSTNENPSHDYSGAEVGNYIVTLIALSPFGCSDTTTSIIQIQEDLIFYIPNTFTPDEDAFNPTFQPIFTSGFDPFDFNLLIFNRWGKIIFESHNAEIGWDGTFGEGNGLVQDGVYTWRIEFKTNKNDERKIAVGHVNVLK